MKQQRILFISIFFVAISTTSHGQYKTTSTIDIVRAKQQYEKEALYFYKNNWKLFREEALKAKHISAYHLMRTPTDSTGHFNLILITEYPDSIALQQAEHNFQPIMKKLRPNGPAMLNEVQRNEFLEYVTGYEGATLFYDRCK